MKNLAKYLKPKLRQNQSGQAAILITLVLTLVMAIIAVGVDQVLNHSIRQTVNYLEGLQANYAAESGVNDAIAAINKGANIPSSTTSCTSFTSINSSAFTYLSSPLNSSSNTKYSCLNVNGTPSTLQATVSSNQSQVLHVQPSPAASQLTFSWPIDTSGNSLSNCTSALQFVPPSLWNCPYPVLRLDLFDNASSVTFNSSSALEAYTISYFIFPVSGGSGSASINFNGNPPQPQVLPAACNATSCSETFNISPAFADGYARLTTYYDYNYSNNVTICGGSSCAAPSSQLSFVNSQIQIDSTGIDQDEIQRIQVRVPYTPTPQSAPNNALAAAVFLCKRYALSGPGSSPENFNSDTNPIDYTAGFPGTDNGKSVSLCGQALKPAIYLYPPHTELVNVKVSYPTGLKTTIPAYNPSDGWNVLAQPNGSLTNVTDYQQYPYLYWEGNVYNFNFDMSQGFVVPGKDTAGFLRHELAIIGLNSNEINGFLQYWVPKMKDNPYSLIHFAGKEYTDIAPLNITPKPDTVLRVFMAEEPISKPVNVTPQHFTAFKRSGFTVVEWGGSVLSPSLSDK